jgi:hypothetical protein
MSKQQVPLGRQRPTIQPIEMGLRKPLVPASEESPMRWRTLMIRSESDVVKNRGIERAVNDRVRAATRGEIRDLEVDCDGEVVTIRGKVNNSYLRGLAFNAAWMAARNSGGLLFDLQVEFVLRGIEERRV